MSDWRPIETAPKDDGSIALVGFHGRTVGNKRQPSYVGEAERKQGKWWWPNDDDWGAINPQPTHWMPLPDPPQEPS